jgi:protein TonB
MEIKKTQQADMEQRRATGFLLGLILVLAVFYVALEWNSVEATADIDPIDLTDLIHESELVPMSNEETIAQLEEKQPSEQGEEINVVDDDVEVEVNDEEASSDDEQLLK